MADTPTRTEKRISSLTEGNYEQDKNSAYLPASVGTTQTRKYPLNAMEQAAKEYTDSAIETAIAAQPKGKWLPNNTTNVLSSGVNNNGMVKVVDSGKVNISGGGNITLMENGGILIRHAGAIQVLGISEIFASGDSHVEYRNSIGDEYDEYYQDLPVLPYKKGPYSIYISKNEDNGYILAFNNCHKVLCTMDIYKKPDESNFSTKLGWKFYGEMGKGCACSGGGGGELDGNSNNLLSAMITIPNSATSPLYINWEDIENIETASFLVIENSEGFNGRLHIFNTPQNMRRAMFVIGIGAGNTVQLSFGINNNTNGSTFNVSSQNGAVIVFSNSYVMYQQVSAGGQMQ